MDKLSMAARRWWHRGSALAKVWTVCVIAAAVGAVLLVASSALAVTTQATAAARPVTATTLPPMPTGTVPAPEPASMPGPAPAVPAAGGAMAAMAPMSQGSGGAAQSTSSICPNVTGATVMPDGMVMAPVPSGPPTPAEQAAADQLVAQVTAGVEQYSNLAVAEADGYAAATAKHGPTTHYLNKAVVRSGDVLDPSHPSSLVYANTVDGPVLIGAMFLGPAPCQPGPDVGGPLTQWHAHDNLCIGGQGQVVGRTSNGGCSDGHHNPSTYFMLHVWTAPSIAASYQFQADLPSSAYTQVLRTGQP